MRPSFSFGKDKMVVLKAALTLLIVADHLTFHVDAAWLFPFRKIGAPIVAVFLFISEEWIVISSSFFQEKSCQSVDSRSCSPIYMVYSQLDNS